MGGIFRKIRAGNLKIGFPMKSEAISVIVIDAILSQFGVIYLNNIYKDSNNYEENLMHFWQVRFVDLDQDKIQLIVSFDRSNLGKLNMMQP